MQEKIFSAIARCDIDLIKLLLKNENILDTIDSDGRTPLIHACIAGENKILDLFLDARADVNWADGTGSTALHFASQNRDCKMASKLLANGAMIEAEDNNGNSPLSNAVFYAQGDSRIINLLLDHGADPEHSNNFGMTPKSLADSIANYDYSHLFM